MATRLSLRTPAQGFALAFGVVYLVVGMLGFAVTGFSNLASPSGLRLIVFELNPLHNVVHILVGIAWLLVSDDHGRSRMVNVIVGVAYLVLALLGFLGVLVENVLALNTPDNVLHLLTGALALFFGTIGAESPETAQA